MKNSIKSFYLLIFVLLYGKLSRSSEQDENDCKNIPKTLLNGRTEFKPENLPYMHGTRAEYVCNDGYTNAGPSIVFYCNNGTWDGLKKIDPTTCVEKSTGINSKDCKSPDNGPPNPHLIITGSYTEGSYVNFRCFPGYYMHPPLEIPSSHCINGGFTIPAPYCILKGTIPSPDLNEPEEEQEGDSNGEDEETENSATVLVGIIVPIVFLLIIAALVGYGFYRRHRNKRDNLVPPIRPAIPEPYHEEPPCRVPSRVIDPREFAYENPTESLPTASLAKGDVKIGTPANDDFENTYYASIRIQGNLQQNAVIRLIKDEFTLEQKVAMEREIEAVFALPVHFAVIRPIAEINVDKMIGVCTERSPKGNLLDYLRSFRDARNSVKPKARELLRYALQIAEGMKFLHEEERVSPMLACRQIMLYRDNVCKVPVLGLKRINREVADIYRMAEELKLLIRWMAPESLSYHIYTKHTDVWTFGIILFELVTLGDIPYGDIAEKDIAQYLADGHRLEKTNTCSERLYSIMKRCWEQEPTNRPSFEELVEELREMKYDDNAISFGPDYVEYPTSGNPFSGYRL